MSGAGQQQGNPLPENGLVGKLTSSQYGALKSFWREFFRLVDSAPERGSSAEDADDEDGLERTEAALTGDQPPLDPDTDLKDQQNGSDAKAAGGPPPSGSLKDEHLKEKLRSEQELRDAKAALERYGKTRFMDTFWNMIMMDDPDVIVLKFLRARKWNVAAGVAMMAACMKWRIEYGVDKIISKGEEGYLNQDGFLHQLKIGKTFVQGTDRQGRPIVYINVRLHKASDQSPKTLEEFIVFSMESVRLMLTPPLVEKVTIIIDMSGFGLANMDWKSLAFIVKCLESYYPESLNVLVVHNPPWVFQGLWKIIAPMLDPVVRAKIQITKSPEELKVHIDEKHLLESLGGTNGWKWVYEPVQKGENELMADTAVRLHEIQNRKKLIKAHLDITRKWAEESGPANELRDDLLVPEDLSVSAQLRKFITYHLRVHYFVLDPYIRGRSIYHRKGRVIGNGLITFEYSQVKLKSETDPNKEELVDLWDVLGYPMSRENLLMSIEKMKVEFLRKNITFPVF
ncbi:hypothetical protein PTTG_07683 [Puccinia triticina 1-1 BBBD Race 1]|uniref:CRAL-TRIO domain-containing protein n=2 Tax=Puccinia triticina TaxID=208348 RepID=A0A180G3B8_PUCT1|nr:uncharacterized protein PtA15_18A240 [Puccinia triticina]OAV87186.1 hypothetical protein PTTG_07683 [Puccinia triticina 1-1 BBBD Race 1]WAQ93182.1 hypothetical protein PtA15_18A240 [Puccinia triticina]WAR63155.1 hypothetical protein PtB15_18B237 [Puccinia triticina]